MKIKKNIFVFFMVFSINFLVAQDQLRMHPGSNLYIHSNADLRVFGNFYNNSSLDSLKVISTNSKLTFYGDSFVNNSVARTAGNGNIHFLRPRPAPYASNASQYLVGGSNVASFPNIYIDNTNGVNVVQTHVKVRDSVVFNNGHLTLNDNNFTLGAGYPGVITGYNQNKYFITNAGVSATSGFLIRQNIGTSNGNIDFPVGRALSDYTPARINNTGSSDTFAVRVFQHVYENATSGNTLELNELSVQRTWNILESVPGSSDVDLTLQHNASTEGSKYINTSNYLSRYWGSTSNTAYLDNSLYSYWDYASPSNSYSNSAGTIVSSGTYGLMSNRANITSNFSGNTQYFTKASSIAPLPLDVINLKASWTNQLKNTALVTWESVTEINVKHYVVERSYNGFDFEFAGQVQSLAPNGNSNNLISYQFIDNQLKSSSEANTVYYRLIQTNALNNQKIVGPVDLIRENALGFDVIAYPNPSVNFVTLLVPASYNNIKGSVNIEMYDAIGKLVFNEQMDVQNLLSGYTINASQLAEGNYQIKVSRNEFSKTFKLLIFH
jgi:hypothetical protein